MNFEATPEVAQLQESLRKYLAAQYATPQRRTIAAGEEGFSRAVWKGLAELGIPALAIAQRHGGFGLPMLDLLPVYGEIGRALLLEPWLAGVMTAAALSRCDGAGDGWLPGIASGALLATVAHAEPGAGHDVGWLQARAQPAGDGWRITGTKRDVLHGASADQLLVSARLDTTADGIGLFAVDPADTTRRPYRFFDDTPAAEVLLQAAPAALIARGAQAWRALAAARTAAIAALAAESVGVASSALDMTVAHVNLREQFGKPLGANQAVRHRVAGMGVALETLRSAALAALLASDAGDTAAARSDLARAKMLVGRHGVSLLQDAVQLHGGIGMTQEHGVGNALRRMAVIDILFGDAGHHCTALGTDLARQAARAWLPAAASRPDFPAGAAPSPLRDNQSASRGGTIGTIAPAAAACSRSAPGDRMDLTLPAQLEAFRDEVRAYIAARLPAGLRARMRRGERPTPGEIASWQRVLHERGWAAPHWPREFGGAELGQAQRLILIEELSRAPAPKPLSFNVTLLGPVLLRFGSAQQKAHWLPRLARLDTWFCQGFSEPGAGSDLAALRTSARREGDAYIVDGQKIWTSLAQHADMMFCLVRTSSAGRKQDGISFLLIDMQTPGITVRPIATIDGEPHLNEVFLDAVRVPAGNMVGSEGQGWEITRFLLGNERTGIADVATCRERLDYAQELAARTMHAGRAAIEDPQVRGEIAWLDAEVRALEITNWRMLLTPSEQARNPSFASVLKLKGTELQQRVAALTLRLPGPDALEHAGFEGEAARASLAASRYLFSRAASIYGGATEIQLDLLARSLLAAS